MYVGKLFLCTSIFLDESITLTKGIHNKYYKLHFEFELRPKVLFNEHKRGENSGLCK